MAVRRLDPDQPATFAFQPENEAWAAATIAKYPAGKQAAAVIPLLWRAQEQCGGWLPEPALRAVGDRLGMAYIRVYEIATFYTMFQLSPVGTKAHVQVCGTTPCMLRGSEALIDVCKQRIAKQPHELSPDGAFSWEEVECLGVCANAPLVQIHKDTFEDLTPQQFERLLDSYARGAPVKPGPQTGRQASCPEGGATTLKDAALYDGTAAREWRKRFPELAAASGAPVAAATPSAVGAAAAAVPAAATPAAVPAINPAALAAMANAGLVKELEARGGGKALSAGEIERLKTELAATPAKAANLLPAPRGGKGDDLKLIWGVAEKLEQRMNELGIWHFDQIAAWSPQEIAWFEAEMTGFKGRIARDGWIEQCRKLASGWRPETDVGEKPKG